MSTVWGAGVLCAQTLAVLANRPFLGYQLAAALATRATIKPSRHATILSIYVT